MDKQQIKKIQKELELLDTDDLVKIWKDHDKSEWTDVAFEAIRIILSNRIGDIPPFEDVDEADKHIKKAEEYLEADELYRALDECNQAIQIAPHFGYAYYVKGTAYDELEKLEDAINLYREALRLSPDLSEARQNLKWALDEHTLKTTDLDERFLAALGHVGILLSTYGVVIPIFIWVTQKEKSRYVTFQSFQALVFQVIWLGLQFVWGISYYFMSNFASSTIFILAKSGIYLIQLIFVIYGLIGAALTLRGKAFHYIGINQIAEKYVRF